MIKTACQTIVFGNPTIKDNLGKYAETVKQIGYDGIEVGVRHFYLERLDYYKDLFTKLKLNLVALHVGGDFLDKDSVKQQLDNVRGTVEFGKKLGVSYIFISSTYRKDKTADDYKNEASSYCEIGKMCNSEGLKFCFHNHDWEFYNNSAGMKIFLDKIPSELMKLVPDVGWAHEAGIDSLQFVKDHIDRIEALHFKEFNKINCPREEAGKGITELGKGLVPFKAIYDYVTSLKRDWWIVAEQDHTNLEPAQAARLNYEFIKGLGK
ncbi:MAG: sugar phosphate isomerase/epimerase [Treponema sp.]|nr:sugar phosphate isomerase/epimerase [Treponema sp.]